MSALNLDKVSQPLATGYNGVPNLPSVPGLESFRGTAIHAGVYKNAAPYQGKRTLVVGCGNSGAEIALDLAEQGVDGAMVVRGPVHVIPRDMFGRPTQHTNGVRTATLSAPRPRAAFDGRRIHQRIRLALERPVSTA